MINGKFYIGKHQTNNINDTYIGSGIALQQAIKIYGKNNFVKEVLFVFLTEEEMNNKEKELVNEQIIQNPLCYNMGIGGEGGPQFKNKKHTKKTLEKMSNSLRGKKCSEKTRKKISESHKKNYELGIGKITKYCGSRKGSKHSEEAKEKIRKSVIEYYNKLKRDML